MKKTSFGMNRHSIAHFFLATLISSVVLISCSKNDPPVNPQVSQYSAEVVDKWLGLQLRLMKNSTGIPNHGLSRQYAYAGIAALEAVAPGLHPASHAYRKWNGLSGLPVAQHASSYYFPANANAALAAMNRSMFPNATAADKTAIDSLEAALTTSFLQTQPQSRIDKSIAFGKAVATAVYAWSETDGYKNANNPYTIPVGPGLWKKTPPALANPATPYWGNNRPVVKGSIDNTMPPPPPAYSEHPGSSFRQMVQEVYDASLVLTADQKAMAMHWRDVPGATTPGHWVSILQQVLKHTNCKLDKAIIAYALTGAAINDASISCFKAKYTYNLLRPITYIREVMSHTTWETYIGTPAHPDYPSGHSVLAGAVAEILEKLFGNIGTFTDHTNDYLGLAPRSYPTFTQIAVEGSQSRLFAGIHFQPALTEGLKQGRKVANNIYKK